ncbi:hypothetical protein CONLIGDRAFT_561409, partial [Coniochaeta ligniaria NRRL 30616]
DDEEDDYMKMTFDDSPALSSTTKPETSLQRRLRLQREGEARARVKSKGELAAEAEAAREKALRTSLLADEARKSKSKGFAMMAKMGFKGGSLGRKDGEEGEEGGAEPIRIEVKDDRGGIGMESEKKRKLKEAAEEVERTAKRTKADEGEYRERVRREMEAARLERQVAAAQKIAERMDEERGGVVPAGDRERGKGARRGIGSRPLKSVNVLWRGLVRAREEAERDRRMRYDLEQSLSRLPTYEDEDEDEDDKRAMGKSKTVFEVAEDLDEEDPELDEFNVLEADEKLRRLVEHLRKEHHYCFWCKFTYPDESMEGCPGLTEEDHD